MTTNAMARIMESTNMKEKCVSHINNLILRNRMISSKIHLSFEYDFINNMGTLFKVLKRRKQIYDKTSDKITLM